MCDGRHRYLFQCQRLCYNSATVYAVALWSLLLRCKTVFQGSLPSSTRASRRSCVTSKMITRSMGRPRDGDLERFTPRTGIVNISCLSRLEG